MIKKHLLSICFILLFFSSHPSSAQNEVIPFNEQKGIQMFLDSDFKSAYWPLIQYYDTQINQTYCGVASAVMVLNALNVPRPYDWPNDYYGKLFTQNNFFSESVCKQVDHNLVLKKGLTLQELSLAMEAWGVQTQIIYADEMTETAFREVLKDNLGQIDRFIIANYFRPLIQGVCGGHFSPIAAYDQNTDSLLILDVYRHQFGPTWIKLSKFFAAIQPEDNSSQMPRGLLLISK